MYRLSDVLKVKLIGLVKLRPALYDRKDENYNNKEFRDNAWEEIARELYIDARSCKTAWRTLRDQFIKNLKAAKSSDPKDARRKRHKFFHKLVFLLKAVDDKLVECFDPEVEYEVKGGHDDELDSEDPLWNLQSHVEMGKSSPAFSENSPSLEDHKMNVFEPIASPSSIEELDNLEKEEPLTTEDEESSEALAPPSRQPQRARKHSTSKGKKRKRSHCTKRGSEVVDADAYQKAFENCLQVVSSQLSQFNQSKEVDGIDNFFMSLSSIVKKYDLSVSDLATFQTKLMAYATKELDMIKNKRQSHEDLH